MTVAVIGLPVRGVRPRNSMMSAAISGPESSCRKWRPVTRWGPSACGSSRLKRCANVDASNTSSSRPQMIKRRQLATRKALLEPFEACCGPSLLIQRNPSRPGPGQQTRRRVGQHRFVRRLRSLAESLAIDDGEIDASPGQGVVSAEEIGADERRMHRAPRENACMELGGRRRPGPRAHDNECAHALGIGQRAAEPRRSAPVVTNQGHRARDPAGEPGRRDSPNDRRGCARARASASPRGRSRSCPGRSPDARPRPAAG